MLRILSVAAALALVVGPARGQDGEAYTIKIKRSAQGVTERIESALDSTEVLKVVDNNGNPLKEEDKKKAKHYVYKVTILEMAAGAEKPARLKRQYEKARVSSGGEMTRLPYEGKAVLIEKKGERYTFRIEGGEELTGADAKELDKEFNEKRELNTDQMEKLFLPGRPVKVNETWKIDVKTLAKSLEQDTKMALDLEKTTATGTLTRVYRKDRRLFGVFVLRLNLAPKSITKDGMTIAFQPNSRLAMEIHYDGCIDGSVTTHSGRFTTEAAIEALLPTPDQPMFRLSVKSKEKKTSKSVEE